MSPFSSCASRNLGTVSEVLGFCPSLVINGGNKDYHDGLYLCVCLFVSVSSLLALCLFLGTLFSFFFVFSCFMLTNLRW